jgi:hypothetical protein
MMIDERIVLANAVLVTSKNTERVRRVAPLSLTLSRRGEGTLPPMRPSCASATELPDGASPSGKNISLYQKHNSVYESAHLTRYEGRLAIVTNAV